MTPLQVLSELRQQYEKKHFAEGVFERSAGYLQTDVEGNDDRMPLQFFVDYNNIWWFSLLYKVEVYHTSYDDRSRSGCICFDIIYGTPQNESRVLRATQYIRFNDQNLISYIRTFGSPQFWSDNPHPAVKLDALGNHIWLGSGYSMEYSVSASKLLLSEAPTVASLKRSSDLSDHIALIQKRLSYYEENGSTQW